MSEKIRILLVDDHEMVRLGLKVYLSTVDEFELVGEACNGEEAVIMAAKLSPDIILMDLVMEVMNGIDATKKIMSQAEIRSQDIKIIILTSFIEEDKVMPALEAGAFSYLLKTTKADEIARAIKKAYVGESVLEGKVGNIVLNSSKKKHEKHDELTQRELEILKELGKGKSNKEISETLFIGIKTVKTHVSSILAKLQIEDRTNAALYAIRHHFVD